MYPHGFPWLTGKKKRRVEAGIALAVIACRLFKIDVAAGARAIFEQPQSSLMWAFDAFKSLHSETKGWFGHRDVCLDGAPRRQPTSLYSNDRMVTPINGVCNCVVKHMQLVGVC